MKTKLLALASCAGLLTSAAAEYALGFDLPLTPSLWLGIALFVLCALPANAALTTNNWTNSVSGLWHVTNNWSGGVPTINSAQVLITNAAGKTVTINETTPAAELTITNLTLRGVGAGNNQLMVSNVSVAPFHIINGLTIGTNAAVTLQSVVLQFDGMNGGFLGVDGTLTTRVSAKLVTTNATFIIGSTRPGIVVNDGTIQSTSLQLANFSVAHATLTTSGALLASNFFRIGTAVGATGTVWVTGGLVIGPDISPLSIGNTGFGNFTVSNGTVRASNVVVSAGLTSGGTLTIAGGTFNASGSILVAHTNTTARIIVAGGTLVATNDQTTIGDTGIGSLTVTGGTVRLQDMLIASNATAGTFSMNGGSVSVDGNLSTLRAGDIWVSTGSLTVASSLDLAETPLGSTSQMTVSNGTVRVGRMSIAVGSSDTGSLTINGGLLECTNSGAAIAALTLGNGAGASGRALVTGGQLVVTNGSTLVGGAGFGFLTITNGAMLAQDMTVGSSSFFSHGTLTVSGGKLAMTGPLVIGAGGAATGTVIVTGGEIVITNTPATAGASLGLFVDGEINLVRGTLIATNVQTAIGNRGFGTLTVGTGGSVLLGQFSVGVDNPGANGTATFLGGTNRMLSVFSVGLPGATGTFWLVNGQLVATNQNSTIGGGGFGRMIMSNGVWLARNIIIAFNGPQSTGSSLDLVAGTTIVTSNVTVGVKNCSSSGEMKIEGGTVFITNTAGTAVLDIESGTLTQTGGTLIMDNLIITNPCAHYVKTGGSFIIKNILTFDNNGDSDGDGMPNGFETDNLLLLFDPRDAAQDADGDGLSNLEEYQAGTSPTNAASALRITDISRQGNNIRVAWLTAPGKTNALQRTAGAAGNFATNNFATIFTVTNTVGSTTNFVDTGAATNAPAFYYRVRLVP